MQGKIKISITDGNEKVVVTGEYMTLVLARALAIYRESLVPKDRDEFLDDVKKELDRRLK